MKLPSIFGRRREPDPPMTRVELSSPSSSFTTRSADGWGNPTFRAAVDAIARAASRMSLSVWANFPDGSSAQVGGDLDRVLRFPNALDTGETFLYKLVAKLYVDGNSWALIDRDGGRVAGIYPLSVSSTQFVVDGAGEVYVKATLRNGRRELFAYRDLIHLKRFSLSSDTSGDDNGPIGPALALSEAQTEGSIAAIESGARIRGILTFNQKLNAEVIEANRRRFVRDYLSLSNSDGVIALDPLASYTPIEPRGSTIGADDQDATDARILRFLGVPKSVVDGSFDDDQWAAFEEAVIEPLANKFSQECTRKLLPERAITSGWEVRCSIAALQFIGNKTKAKLLEIAVPQSVITVNEARDILGLEAIEGGDVRILSLNYCDATIASEYQLGRAGVDGVKSLKADSRVSKGDE